VAGGAQHRVGSANFISKLDVSGQLGTQQALFRTQPPGDWSTEQRLLRAQLATPALGRCVPIHPSTCWASSKFLDAQPSPPPL
jgi:hypothetical protein